MAVRGSENVVIPSSFLGLRVLLVDHDIKSLAHIASLLEQQSYQVTATERATAALSMMQEGGQYELVLADVNMVEMDCLKFIKEISQHNLPIVVMGSTEDMNKVDKVISEFQDMGFVLQKHRAQMFMPTTSMTMAGSSACGATYLTLETLMDQLKIGEGIPARNTTSQTFNHGGVWGLNIGNGKLLVALGTSTENLVPGMILSELNYPSHNLQNLSNSSTPNSDVPGCLENSNHLTIKYMRELQEGGSNQTEAMEGVTSSLNEEQESSRVIDMIAKHLEDEDAENSVEIMDDDLDRYLQYLWPPSDFE